MSAQKNSRSSIRLPLLISIAIAGGILIGATVSNNSPKGVAIYNNIQKFKEILTYVQRDYVDEVNTDELAEYAIREMLEKLDPHTVYIPAENVAAAKSELEGGFDGIGIEFGIFRDTLYVVAPINGGPSEQVGLRSGDKIIEVDGENIAGIGINNYDVYKRLRGHKGTKVNVKIKRDREAAYLDYTIVRDKIPQNTVDVSYMIDKETGYIKLSRFGTNTYNEFKTALKKLNGMGMKKLVLDLKGNGGGIMQRAIEISDEFLDNNQLIVYTKGKDNRYDSEARARIKGIAEDIPLIVLIDQGSASASEIVSGALQDNDRALIVGRRSFGKGLVQVPIDLSDGSELRLTISRYYTPSGRSIQKPYRAEDNDYDQEIYTRLENGEFFHADSVKFNDSLTYRTSGGRVVYGGGGIMPDYFVPIDTTFNSAFLRSLYVKNLFREYTLNYTSKNEEMFKEMSLDEFKQDFKISEGMIKDFIALAELSGITFDKAGFDTSKAIILSNIKAHIGRRIWGEEGYYPIINEHDEILTRAIGLFDKAKALSQHN
ncbi:S41 family peptidase [Fulvivirgaceae bacterium BMA12]|uniref:S41 family peptidase n=1 Tax=Agaribacillus aureus TaxID=3051825 RepID=A0ABT8L9Y4_9BACT|nr:S41 family peptidase [Fulvivirgaceae bacterium BMA12]